MADKKEGVKTATGCDKRVRDYSNSHNGYYCEHGHWHGWGIGPDAERRALANAKSDFERRQILDSIG